MKIKPGDKYSGWFNNLIHEIISIHPSGIKVKVKDYYNIVEYKTTKENLIKYKRKINYGKAI